MTINESIEAIRTARTYTEENLEDLKKAVEEANIESFNDERFKYFAKFIESMPYHDTVKDIVMGVSEKLVSKGLQPPCFGECSEETCAFHSLEFPESK